MFSNASSLIRAPPRLAVATMLVTPSCAKMFACIRKSTPNLRHFRGYLIFARGSCTDFCKSGWCMAFHDGPPRLHKPPPHLHPILPQILQCTLSLVRKIHKPAGRFVACSTRLIRFWTILNARKKHLNQIIFDFDLSNPRRRHLSLRHRHRLKEHRYLIITHHTHVTRELEIRGSMRSWLCPMGFSPLDGDSHSMQLVSFTANSRKLESQNASMLNSQRKIHAMMFATHLPCGFSKNKYTK